MAKSTKLTIRPDIWKRANLRTGMLTDQLAAAIFPFQPVMTGRKGVILAIKTKTGKTRRLN